MKEVEIIGVRVEMPSNQPIVLLREHDAGRYLPIWIGAVEATAIAMAQQGMTPDRPLTHDLLRDVIDAHGAQLDQVDIVDLRDGIFFAELVFASGVRVSARPSDAIAVALRTGSPVFVKDAVLEEAAVELPDEGPDEAVEVEKFREFLDQISPEDFGIDPGGSR
jgi:bifunctional DNase/RNase